MAADTYCNITTDLQREVPQIETYDQKRRIRSFQLVSGSVYKALDTGFVESLFRSGVDLGDPESAAVDVDADGEWHYDADTDTLTIASTSNPNSFYSYKAGRPWATVKQEAVDQASEEVRFEINRQIFRLPLDEQGSASREWPAAIIRATAKLACYYLISPYDAEEAARLQRELFSKEEGAEGLLVRLKSGDLALPDAATIRMASGELRRVSRDDASTGQIVGTKGSASIDHDLILITIATGGTLALGTASPVKYTAKIKSSTGLQTQTSYEDETVTGGYDPVGHGVSVMFAPGDYTAGDTWTLEVNGQPVIAGEKPLTTLVNGVVA